SGPMPAVVAGLLGVLSLAGLIVVAALPTTPTATSADVPGYYLVPLDTFRLDAKVVGHSVRLSWESAGPGGRKARYAIMRTAGCTRSDRCRVPRWSGGSILARPELRPAPGATPTAAPPPRAARQASPVTP